MADRPDFGDGAVDQRHGRLRMTVLVVMREGKIVAQPHIGGHAITSGGNLPLGGGTSYQKKYGIADSPDLFFQDLTDWSVVETNGFPPYRYNDREIIRAFADNCQGLVSQVQQTAVQAQGAGDNERRC